MKYVTKVKEADLCHFFFWSWISECVYVQIIGLVIRELCEVHTMHADNYPLEKAEKKAMVHVRRQKQQISQSYEEGLYVSKRLHCRRPGGQGFQDPRCPEYFETSQETGNYTLQV